MTADVDTAALGDGPWSPLRIRIYRSLWIAALVSNVGTFMHLVAAGWSMSDLSSSPTLVGMVQAAWAVPGFLLALHAGAFADVIDRRRLLVITQLAALGVAAVLGVVELADRMTPGLLLAGTFLESVALTMAAPAFMALTPELVGPRHLAQALGLDAISRNSAQATGPALAGAVISASGPGGVFLLNAASFLGVLVAVRRYQPAPPARANGIGHAIREGLTHLRGRRELLHPLARLALMSATGAAVTAVMPLVARERLHTGAGGFGILSAALGLGSVIAVWVLPRVKAPEHPETALAAAALCWSAGAACCAVSTTVWAGAPSLLLAGAGAMGTLNVLFANYTLQLDQWVRGRGSAMAMLMVWLGASVGALAWGATASAIGVGAVLGVAAAVNLAVALACRPALPVRPAALIVTR